MHAVPLPAPSLAPLRSHPPEPVQTLQERLQVLDSPHEWEVFSTPWQQGAASPPDCWESRVVLEGMHCAACAFTIEDALQATPGVVEAEVNAATRRARVVWSATGTRPSDWMGAVRQAGYTALPAGDALLREARQKELRQALWRWLVAGFCMMQVMMYAVPAYTAAPGEMTDDMVQLLRWASWVISLPVMFFSCGPFFSNAWRDLRYGRINMDLPAALGMAITFIVSTAGTFDPTGPLGHEVFFDSLTMFVFFLLTGRWLEMRLRDRTAGALEALGNRLPDSVLRVKPDGTCERVVVRRLVPGDVVHVLPGEAFPADGTILVGDTLADEALLSGESRPVPRPVGSQVMAGSNNLLAAIQMRVDRIGVDTRFAQIVALMEDAAQQKPRMAQLADRIAKPFLIFVLLAAVGAGLWWWPSDPGHALMIAAAVLIVTCPCALSLATPAAMLAAAGTLARGGVLVRDLRAMEALSEVDTVVFDKTGTLTRDGMAVTAVRTRAGIPPGAALSLAAALAQNSLHPASQAITRHFKAQAPGAPVHIDAVQEHAGAGLTGALASSVSGVQGKLRLGSAALCGFIPTDADTPQVHLADDAGWLATFDLSEDIRADASVAIAALQHAGTSVQLLSGDGTRAVERVAAAVGIQKATGACSPDGKLERLQALQKGGHRVAMVGDGLNDGPVLAAAHASFAFGLAVPLAQARSDFVVLGDQLQRVPQALLLARKSLRIVRQNLGWAAAYNIICVPLALAGLMPAWLAGLGMALSSLLVVLNAARLSRPLPGGDT